MLIGLDIGSSSAKAVAIEVGGRARRTARRRFATRRRAGGRVEHDPEDLLRAAVLALGEAAARAPATGARLGIATQRSTCLFWDRGTGRALTPAWSWQDVRARDLCRRLARADPSLERWIAARTGLRLSPHYAAPKLARALARSAALRRGVASGRVLWGTLATWLAWRLTGGAFYAIDHANAQRTLLMGLDDLAWDPALFRRLGLAVLLEAPVLPALVPTRLASEAVVAVGGRSLRLAALTGDQQAALEGLRCRRAGDVVINYGSGAFVLLQTGPVRVRAPGLLTSIVDSRRAIPGGPGVLRASYAVEGTVNSAATAVDWVARRVGRAVRTGDLDRLLGPDPGAAPRTLHFLPAVAGLGAPRWDPRARPFFAGRSRASADRDLLAAAVEGIAQRCAEIVRAAEAHLEIPAHRPGGPRRAAARTAVRVSGGLTRCHRLLRMQANLLQRPVVLGPSPDATAAGAALLAAGDGRPAGPEPPGEAIEPSVGRAAAVRLWRAWERAVYGRAPAAGAVR